MHAFAHSANSPTISTPHTEDSQYPLTDELSHLLSDTLQTVLQGLQRYRLSQENRSDLCYEVIGDLSQDRPCLVFANGLGGRLYTWLPLIEAFAGKMNIITWDYRGLFDSHGTHKSQELSIVQHANDLRLILDTHQVQQIHLCGWSMGVQVSLEFTARNPTMVQSLTLLNGTYGQVFSTAFQPWLRLPLPTWALHEVVEGLKNLESLTRLGLKGASIPVELLFKFRQLLMWMSRQKTRPFLMLAARQYCRDLFTGEHLSAYLSLFQHLDAHSVYHLLPQIHTPTLVISGGLDFLTPAYQSQQITRRLSNAQHKKVHLASHFVLLERPRLIVQEIRQHLVSCGVYTLK
jgi:3-oxoadipate enol-lactonase